MTWKVEATRDLNKFLSKRDDRFLERVAKKVDQIKENPLHFKPLRGDRKGSRRVHIDHSFVLIFEIKDDKIILLDINHHDKIY